MAIAAGTFVFVVTGAALVGAQASEPNLTALGVLVLALESVPLVWRRRAPIPVWIITGLAVAWYGAAEWPDPLVPLGVVFGLAAVFECCTRRTAYAAWIVSAIFAPLSMLIAGDSDARRRVGRRGGAPARPAARRPAAPSRAPTCARWRSQRRGRRSSSSASCAPRSWRSAPTSLASCTTSVAHHVSMIVVQAEAGAATATVRHDAPAADAFDAIGQNRREPR